MLKKLITTLWMFFTKQVKTFALLVFFGLNASCISIDLDWIKDQKAKGVVFQAPNPPYQKIETNTADKAWQNPKNGNTISFISNCSYSNQLMPLKNIQTQILSDLNNFHIVSEHTTSHQNQKALSWIMKNKHKKTNKLQTIKTKMLLFKKQDCFYAISFVSSPPHTESSHIFDNFIKGFKAP